jgi:NO-binding membrane sensor protein with MHYT domain
MIINYQGRRFRPVDKSSNSDTSAETIFLYQQQGRIVTATYTGGAILTGHLIGLVDVDGVIEMRYHHVNTNLELQTGVCRSTPEVLPDGRVRLHETWQWTSGGCSAGRSVIEEL